MELGNFANRVLGTLFLLLAIYLIIGGIRASFASGFKFYLAPVMLHNIPMLLVSLFIIAVPNYPHYQWVYVIFYYAILPFIFLVARGWIADQQEKVRDAIPSSWSVWEKRINQANLIDKALFYPIVPKWGEQTNGSEMPGFSNRGFWIVTGILGLIFVLGIATIFVFAVLLRRG